MIQKCTKDWKLDNTFVHFSSLTRNAVSYTHLDVYKRQSLAWLIPILAGLTQYASTKLMMATQPKKNNEEDMSSQMMQSMNVTMPLMSVFFCFTFPAAIGIYWVASSTFQLLQQLVVNSYLDKVDMDELIRKNVEKANKKLSLIHI